MGSWTSVCVRTCVLVPVSCASFLQVDKALNTRPSPEVRPDSFECHVVSHVL